jgi:signal transduction histidine kinase/ActR/RegA family two-component response regulator
LPPSPQNRRLALVAGALACLAGGLALTGWILGVDVLKSIVPGTITMKPNTAIAFFALGGAIVVASRSAAAGVPGTRQARLADGLAAIAGLLGAIVGAQYVLGDLGVDQLLFREPPGAVGTVHPGRMSPQTTISLVLLGAAFLLGRRGKRGPIINLMASVPALLGGLNLLDAFLGAATPTFLGAFTQMALPTAATFVVLGFGVLDVLPGRTLLDRFRGGSESSVLGRRLLFAALTIPIAVAWLRLEGERAGLYDTAFGVSLTTIATIALFLVVILGVTSALQASEARRAVSEADTREARRNAEDANHAKTEFLSRMSHELRTPLNAILGFAQLLEMDDLPPEQRENVRYIRRGGEQLLGLINEVLDISKIEVGALSLSPEPVWLPDVLDEQQALMMPMAAERGVTIAVRATSAMTGHVMADRQRLKQVLLNLLSNAVKYNRVGGQVWVDCREAGPGRLRIDVIDTGFGIPPENLDRLFVPFDRLGAERSGVEGTGIGLTLTRRLVQEMGGALTVRSVLGEGSTFSVELARVEDPVRQVTRIEPEVPARTRSAGGRSKTVLHIEDNLSNLRLVEQLVLQRPEVRLIAAIQGRLGLELAREHRPDLILLDLHLPDMKGVDVLAELQGDPGTRGIPVVVVTADATVGLIERLKASGARDHMTKPLDVEAFLRLLDSTPGRAVVGEVEAVG